MIGEFRLIEAYMYASIEQQTHDPYTCNKYSYKYHRISALFDFAPESNVWWGLPVEAVVG
eukprot:6213091-Pleurochrysis_carterae.AAC.1